MKLPNFKNKRAVYVESREARAVIIEEIYRKGDFIEIRVKADESVSHMRTWLEEEPYKKRNDIESTWTLSCRVDSIVLDQNFAKGPIVGWQLLAEDQTCDMFSLKDDNWVDEWF